MNNFLILLLCLFLLYTTVFYLFSKKIKGVVLMYCTQNIIDKWGHYTIDTNKKYAHRNGYDFVLIKEPYDANVTHAWQKIPAMENLLEKGYDFVFYIDTDAIVNKQNIRIENFLKKYPNDLLVCSDVGNSNGKYKVNGGVVIARNTKNAKKLLKRWWELRNTYKEFAYEQWALSDIYEDKIEGIPGIKGNKLISVAPENEFNSLYSDVLNYSKNLDQKPPDHFILHFMAMNDETRENIFKEYLKNKYF